jgi:hypothetical protein
MTKRARYDGPHEAVLIFDSEASVEAPPLAEVQRGGLLPADVPARIRDELLGRDNWSEVNQAESTAKTKD